MGSRLLGCGRSLEGRERQREERMSLGGDESSRSEDQEEWRDGKN